MISTALSFNVSLDDLCFYRVHTFDFKAIPFSMEFMSQRGFEVVAEWMWKDSKFQRYPPTRPLCFSKAILGTGNRCSLDYCETRLARRDFEYFRSLLVPSMVATVPATTGERTQMSSLLSTPPKPLINVGILNRRNTRMIDNL